MKVLLERESLILPEIQYDKSYGELEKLAGEAALKLFYHRLQDLVSEKSGKVGGPLVKLLYKLDIRPFTLKSVVNYKAWKLVDQFEKTGREWWWAQSSLASFGGDIPEFVIRKALQISDGLHKAGVFDSNILQIESLVDWANTMADPFLVVAWRQIRCYVEVFDEIAFESELLK